MVAARDLSGNTLAMMKKKSLWQATETAVYNTSHVRVGTNVRYYVMVFLKYWSSLNFLSLFSVGVEITLSIQRY